MKKKFMIPAIAVWLAAVVFITLIASSTPPEEVKVDLSEIYAGQIMAGTNIIDVDFECSYETFVGRSYRFDLVLVGIDRDYSDSVIVFLGREPGWRSDEWYRAEKEVEGLGWHPAAKAVILSDHTLTIYYGKNNRGVFWGVAAIILASLLIGGSLFSEARNQKG